MKKIPLLLMMGMALCLFPQAEKPQISITAPARDEIWFGKMSIHVDARNLPQEMPHALEVFVNGRLTKEFRKPPYIFYHDFGQAPQNSTIKAVLRVHNQVVSSAEIRSFPIDDAQEVEVTQILVPVVVTDAKGNYVSDLGKEDFILLEDNQVQAINNFSRSGKNEFHLALLIDISSSMKDQIGEVKAAAKQFLQQLLTKNDKAIVVFFNHEVFEDTDFSSDIAELSNSISMAFPFGATALYDAVGYCIKMFMGVPGLNIIIILSDGEDNSSFMDAFTLIKKAEKSNTVIYAIGKSNPSYSFEYQEILRKLAQSSGGILFFIENSQEIQKVYELIRRDIRAEYTLEFSPRRRGKSKRFRQISVKLKNRKKYSIRTIKGFYY